ncbi:MAG: helicase C-terminal domain-containing protein [Acidobacteriota bacterium]|nr:DEAD/DEAH box helicase [Blastocatellia bacterium]MDW8240653.1 helicase C-terminal domain-containing protein [Acidobacteriota bacterium]
MLPLVLLEYNPSAMPYSLRQVFEPGGLIAQHHPNYEDRPGQLQMAQAVLEAISEGGHLCVEAGTGTGKTLAYLVPALAAHERVIISTGTKNLQEQLYAKDVPFLEQALGRKLRICYMKGRSNYVCLYRLKKADQAPILEALDEMDYFKTVRQWAFQSETGDRAELSDLPESLGFWSSVDARSEICLGQKCPDYEPCFITRMRQRALESDIVIVNHHLFFADLALRGQDYGAVLPEYSVVIFDEAHELEDVASEYFGAQVSNYRIAELVRDAQNTPITDTIAAGEIVKVCARLKQRADRFWQHFVAAPDRLRRRWENESPFGPEGRYALDASFCMRRPGALSGRPSDDESPEDEPADSLELTPAGQSVLALLNALTRLETTLASLKDAPPEVSNLVRRAGQVRHDLEFIMSCAEPEYVYWYERRGRGIFLQATPIDVSSLLAERLFDRVPTAILTSATLASNQSFSFIRSRLGIKQARELIIPSHFDFARQAILYLPPHLPDPREPGFLEQAVEEIIKVLEITSGRAFVLFTSVNQMTEAYKRVSARVSFPCLLQGQGSKGGLLQRFRRTPHAVLFATSSFWQGVDVQGEALSCVIIDRLPFAVPTDPVVAARCRYIQQRGGDPFYEYSLPQAVLMLKQGLGRLIRSKDDVGVLCVLDPRLRTKSYGEVFLRSLPPCPVTTDINQIARVFD